MATAKDVAMENAGYISLSRQVAMQRQMDVIANNLANMNTTAFRGENILFEEYLVNTGSQNKASFVQDYGMLRDTREGELRPTGRPLDLAISGKGFFQVDTPQGPRFSRNGQLRLDADGKLVSNEGYPIMDDRKRPIVLSQADGSPTISKDGTIATALGAKVARIELVKFDNEQNLKKTEGSLYTTDEAPKPSIEGVLAQGMIESSNIAPVVEMTRMIELSRSYQTAQKLLENDHDRLRKAVERLARVA